MSLNVHVLAQRRFVCQPQSGALHRAGDIACLPAANTTVGRSFSAPTTAGRSFSAPLMGRGEPAPYASDRPAPASGLYHMTAAGRTSWHGFASAILAEFGLSNPVTAIPASEYPTPARRPANSVLDNSCLAAAFGIRLPDWKEGLRETAAALRQ